MSDPAFSSDNGLIFQWEPAGRRKKAIVVFLFASIVGHAFCFYMFQIIYPPAVALLPPPARVTMIAPATEEGRTLLRWIEAEDPALASSTQRPPDAKDIPLPVLQHVPSYLNMQPALKTLPPLVPDLRVPSSQPPAAVPLPRTPKISSAPVVSTNVTFTPELASLGTPQTPAVKWTASTREPPQAAEFHVAVTSRGVVAYCFLANSSGDHALDEQAQKFLALCRFTGAAATDSPHEQDLTWAIATVEWGNDLVLPPSPSAEAPAP